MDLFIEDIETEMKETKKIKTILHPKENVAFLDAEFNQDNQNKGFELLSVGIIVCNSKLEEIDRYYSLIKPNKFNKINSSISELTKITQKNVNNNSQDFYKVSVKISDLLQKYKVKKIYAWGSQDKLEFIRKARLWKKSNAKTKGLPNNVNEKFKYIEGIEDISENITNYLINDLNNKEIIIRMELLTYLTNVKNKHQHNALYDAEALKSAIYAISNNKIDKCRLALVKGYYRDMRRYSELTKYYASFSKKKNSKIIHLSQTDDFLKKYHSDIEIKAYIDIGVKLGIINADIKPKYYSYEEYENSKRFHLNT